MATADWSGLRLRAYDHVLEVSCSVGELEGGVGLVVHRERRLSKWT